MDNLKKPDRYDKANEIIQIFFESFLFLSRSQIGLEISMKGSDFIFDGVDLLHLLQIS